MKIRDLCVGLFEAVSPKVVQFGTDESLSNGAFKKIPSGHETYFMLDGDIYFAGGFYAYPNNMELYFGVHVDEPDISNGGGFGITGRAKNPFSVFNAVLYILTILVHNKKPEKFHFSAFSGQSKNKADKLGIVYKRMIQKLADSGYFEKVGYQYDGVVSVGGSEVDQFSRIR